MVSTGWRLACSCICLDRTSQGTGKPTGILQPQQQDRHTKATQHGVKALPSRLVWTEPSVVLHPHGSEFWSWLAGNRGAVCTWCACRRIGSLLSTSLAGTCRDSDGRDRFQNSFCWVRLTTINFSPFVGWATQRSFGRSLTDLARTHFVAS